MDGNTIRTTVLHVIEDKKNTGPGYFQQDSLLGEIATNLNIHHNVELEQALLTAWHDLFRLGYLSWGYNLSNPNPPFVHITDKGRSILQNLSRDPSNPDGYFHYLRSKCSLNPIAESYAKEAVDTFNSNCFKAAAVMIGAAAESLILELRDTLLCKMNTLQKNIPTQLNDWKIKTVFDQIEKELNIVKKAMPHKLKELFSSYWTALYSPIRMARNDAGHPTSIQPVTFESVHASLLIFPELAMLISQLKDWIQNDYT